MRELDSTQEQGPDSRAARVMPGTTAGGEHHATTHAPAPGSWGGGRSLEAELEYQSTLASLALIDEPEPVYVGHDGRYAIHKLIGRGAMGAVYFADDLALRRSVAIKVVSKVVGDRQHFQDRLRREAWALALLDHPNVLQVYDVDVAASGELFIVMQYVAGRNLREWVEATQPSRAQLLEVFVAAGHGLAAAHRKGLVHRDFKPDNVLIREAGADEPLARRVLVGDFGLAGGAALELAAAGASPSEALALDELPVHTARFLGTPAYMSPEQRRCEALDARSDQFSYCVSLWELLLGERPLGSLVERRPQDLAPWLYKLMRRGLSAHPEQRYADMSELLDALEHTPARRRRWLSLAGAAGVGGVLALGGALALQPGTQAQDSGLPLADPCAEIDAPLVEVWNPARKAALEARLVELDLPGARELAARTSTLLDRAAERWRDDRRDSCEAAPLVESPCHARWLARFDRRVQLLDSIDEARAGSVLQLVEPLVSNSICAAPVPPLEPELDVLLETAEDATLLADYGRALELGERVHAAAAELPSCVEGGDYSLEAGAAAYRMGDVHGERHDGVQALKWLREAQRHARACEDDPRLLAASLRAAKIQAVDLREPAAAHELLLDAESLAARRPELAGDLEWELHLTRGLVALELGELGEAQASLRAALALPDAAIQPLRSTEALLNLGVALFRADERDAAAEQFDAAAARIREAYGALVPELDLVRFNRASLLTNAGDHDAALALLEPLRESPYAKVRFAAFSNLALIHAARGDLDALRADALALGELLDAHPEQDPLDRALALHWRGQSLANDGDPAGLEDLREALALFERHAPTGPKRDETQVSLAWNLLEHGQLDEALAHVRALESRTLSPGMAEQMPQLRADLQEKLPPG